MKAMVHAKQTWQQKINDSFTEEGSFEVWQHEVLQGICNCHGLAFSFSATLAAPLLYLLNVKPFFLVLKSTGRYEPLLVSEIVRSAWYHPDSPRFCCDSDHFFLRQLFDFVNDLPVALDVAPSCKQRDYSRLVSCFESTALTLDCDMDGNLRSYLPPRTVVIVTDESNSFIWRQLKGPIVQVVSLDDQDFPISLNEFQGFKHLRRICQKNFGHFGSIYTSRIVELQQKGILQPMYVTLLNTLDLQQNKDATRYAAMLTGALIVGQLFGDQYSRPLMAAVYKRWLKA